MAAEWWWFLVVNAVVAAIAVLSSRARPPLALASPRRGAGDITRRASSAVLQRLRSFSIFSFHSTCFHTALSLQPDATATATAVSQETEEPVASPIKSPALALPSPPPAELATVPAQEDEDDQNAMSMEQAYELALAARRRPERQREEEARRSEVDAKAEEFIRGLKEDLRQQRLNSIFNYTQMLKQRALGAGGRHPDARPDQL